MLTPHLLERTDTGGMEMMTRRERDEFVGALQRKDGLTVLFRVFGWGRMVVCGGAALLIAAAMYVSGDWRGFIIPLVVMTLVGFQVFFLRRSLGTNVKLIGQELRSRGCCLHCGYDLREVREQEDGCRVWPECAGAWRL